MSNCQTTIGVYLLVGGTMAMNPTGRCQAQEGNPVALLIDANWEFVGGPWTQSADGIIQAPGNSAEQNLAFRTDQAYDDFEAEFEFRWDWVWTHTGFVFRAADPQHYYMVFFPAVGQQYRAEHFWGCIAKVDERGYVEVLSDDAKIVSHFDYDRECGLRV